MEIKIDIEQSDWLKLQKLTLNNIRKNTKCLANFRTSFILAFIVTFATAFMMGFFQIDLHLNTNILSIIVFIIFFLSLYYSNKKLVEACAPSRNGLLVGGHTLRFDSSGIHANSTLYEAHYRWAAVKEIVHAAGLILIYIDTVFAILIPDNQVGDVDTFIKTIEGYRNNSSS